MDKKIKTLLFDSRKNQKNLLAPEPINVVAFRKYTQSVWSKMAGRPISDEEVDRIIEDFGQFLRILAKENGSQ